MRVLRPLLASAGTTSALILLLQSPAFASGGVTPFGCSGSACSIGVTSSAANATSSGNAQATSTAIGAGMPSASGPCPAGQTANYQTQTLGGQPVTAELPQNEVPARLLVG